MSYMLQNVSYEICRLLLIVHPFKKCVLGNMSPGYKMAHYKILIIIICPF